jgi:hypothetical protein
MVIRLYCIGFRIARLGGSASRHASPSMRRRRALMSGRGLRPTRWARAIWTVAFCASSLLLGLTRPAAAEPVRLRLSFQLPLTGSLGVNLVRLKEEVARQTNNEVAIEILHGAQACPTAPSPSRSSPEAIRADARRSVLQPGAGRPGPGLPPALSPHHAAQSASTTMPSYPTSTWGGTWRRRVS